MLSKFSSGNRRSAAEESIAEAHKLYELAEQLNAVALKIEDAEVQQRVRSIVREILQSSRKLSSLSSTILR